MGDKVGDKVGAMGVNRIIHLIGSTSSLTLSRPVGRGPFAKALYVERSAHVVSLDGITLLERVVRQLLKDAEESLAVLLGGGRKHFEDAVIDCVFVGRDHRPWAESLSCNCWRSSGVWPWPERQ